MNINLRLLAGLKMIKQFIDLCACVCVGARSRQHVHVYVSTGTCLKA